MINCEDCGWVPKCVNCAVSLTYHQFRNALICHYCGTEYPVFQANDLTFGINISPGVATSNNNITGNIISNITSSGQATAYGINVASASGGITIQQNNISNIKNTNAAGYGAYGIGLSSTVTKE